MFLKWEIVLFCVSAVIEKGIVVSCVCGTNSYYLFWPKSLALCVFDMYECSTAPIERPEMCVHLWQVVFWIFWTSYWIYFGFLRVYFLKYTFSTYSTFLESTFEFLRFLFGSSTSPSSSPTSLQHTLHRFLWLKWYFYRKNPDIILISDWHWLELDERCTTSSLEWKKAVTWNWKPVSF